SSLDVTALRNAAASGSTQNTSEGWVQNINAIAAQSAVDGYSAQIQSIVNAKKPGATANDIFGTSSIVPVSGSQFSASLPYKTIASPVRLSELPASLRHQFRYKLYASAADRVADNPIWTFQRSLPLLAGH